MKHLFFYVFLLSFIFSNCIAFDSDDHANACRGYTELSGTDLSGGSFEGMSFKEVDFWGTDLWLADLRNCDLQKTCLYIAGLERSDLQNADLRNADATKADFSYAKMHGVKLDGIKVEGANFKCAKGLTPEQKEYLREHGAINVPVDFVYEPDDSEAGHEVAAKKSFKKRVLGFFTRKYKRYFHTQNASTQTSKTSKKRKRRS